MPYHDHHRMDDTDDLRGTDGVALVQRAVSGDDRAFGRLYDLWFDRVHDTACRIVHDRATGADIAQDAFLRAWRAIGTVTDPETFGGWLLRITRNVALDHVRRSSRASIVDEDGFAMIERQGAGSPTAPAGFGVEDRMDAFDDPAGAAEHAEVVALVQESVDALDGRDAEVLHLGLRYGLSPAEIGEAVGLNRNAANQAVHRARRRLRTAVEARVLWRRGRPECTALAAVLTASTVEAFDARAVPIIDAHAKECSECSERRRLRLEPAHLFGAIPLAAGPSLLKAKIAAALEGQGVPMHGSTFAADAPGGPGARNGNADPPELGPETQATETQGTETQATEAHSSEALPASSPTRRSARRALVTAAIVVAVVAAGIGLSAATRDDEPQLARSGPQTQASTAISTTRTSAVPTTAPTTTTTTPTTTTVVVVAPPSTRAPEPPTTIPPTAPVTASLTLSRTSIPRPWTMVEGTAPRITWSSANATSVTVSGPGFTSTAPSGSSLICPTGSSTSVCNPAPGTYQYTLDARDGSGTVVITRQVILVVT